MYTNEMDFGTWVTQASNQAKSLIDSIEAGKIIYDKWYQLSYGLSDAEIVALPQFAGKVEADITTLRYAIGVFNDLNTALGATQRGYLMPII